MNERIETNFKELKEYEKIESYYDYLEQAEHFFRDVFGDRVESQKYIIRANKEIERLHSIIKEVREYIEENQEEHKYTDRGSFTYTEGHFLRDSDTLLEILDKGNNDE